MRYDHLEDHFDINNDDELDFMEKSMMEAYVWETFREEKEEEVDDYDMSREERDLDFMDREELEDLYGDDVDDLFGDDFDEGDDW